MSMNIDHNPTRSLASTSAMALYAPESRSIIASAPHEVLIQVNPAYKSLYMNIIELEDKLKETQRDLDVEK